MNDLDQEFYDVLKTCKFVSKKDEWFVEGSEVKLISEPWGFKDKMNSGIALFEGFTNETYSGYKGELPRLDEENCPLSEFYIYDTKGNDITELTLDEYRQNENR